ncbi:MAG: DUF2147 domain-containing protein [Acidobacteriota bacterium]
MTRHALPTRIFSFRPLALSALAVMAVLALVASLAVGAPTAFAADADAIVGVWETSPEDASKGKARIEIYEDGGKYFGKIVWLEKPIYQEGDGYPDLLGEEKLDLNNPDESKQKDTILGLNLLKDFKHKGDSWEGGTIYDPENGKTYKSILRIGDGGETLKVRGFIGFSFIGRTSEWTRVKDNAQAQPEAA